MRAIQTFAGGGLPVNIAGTFAMLDAPNSVAADAAGNLFFTNGRNIVLRLDAATGILTLMAGNGTAGYSGDNGPATSAQLSGPDIKYAGGAPGMVAGLMQVNVEISAGIQTGSAVPVVLKVGNALSQGSVTVAVH